MGRLTIGLPAGFIYLSKYHFGQCYGECQFCGFKIGLFLEHILDFPKLECSILCNCGRITFFPIFHIHELTSSGEFLKTPNDLVVPDNWEFI